MLKSIAKNGLIMSGAVLALALVAALCITLAAAPASALPCEDCVDESGTGSTVDPLDSAVGSWRNGLVQTQIGYDGNLLETSRVYSYVGFRTGSGSTSPSVGEVYEGHLSIKVTGNPVPGGSQLVSTSVWLPADSQFALDAANIRCYYKTLSGSWVEVTNEAAANCPRNPGRFPNDGSPRAGSWDLGSRLQSGGGTQFEIVFPLRSTTSPTGKVLRAHVESAVTQPPRVYPEVTVGQNTSSTSTLSSAEITRIMSMHYYYCLTTGTVC